MLRPVIHRIGPAMLVAFGLLIGSVAPALASAVERQVVVEKGVSSEEACGLVWSVRINSKTVSTLKASHGNLPPKFSARTRYRTVFTDLSNPDRGFVRTGKGLFKDLYVRHVRGTTYEFRSLDIGRSTISTLGGKTIAADRGRIAWTFLIDTHGSFDPDDYELLDGTITKVSGPHPILESGDDGCEMILDGIG
jgi:hypothetical protein